MDVEISLVIFFSNLVRLDCPQDLRVLWTWISQVCLWVVFEGAGNWWKLLYIFKDSSCNITSMSGPYGTGALKKKVGMPHLFLSYSCFEFALCNWLWICHLCFPIHTDTEIFSVFSSSVAWLSLFFFFFVFPINQGTGMKNNPNVLLVYDVVR